MLSYVKLYFVYFKITRLQTTSHCLIEQYNARVLQKTNHSKICVFTRWHNFISGVTTFHFYKLLHNWISAQLVVIQVVIVAVFLVGS